MVLVLNDQNFEKEVLKAEKPVLVDFWAPWCGPCLMAGPVVETLAEEYQDKVKVGKLNVDESPKMAVKYGVMSIPTVIIFNQGKEVKKQIGFPGKKAYQKLIEEVI
ncbi:MAG: thioredoxin [Candidatus Marinimicrobia bacterium]|nr:thioredoxin [Candidatus Neomarinimicrobiota bacterium]